MKICSFTVLVNGYIYAKCRNQSPRQRRQPTKKDDFKAQLFDSCNAFRYQLKNIIQQMGRTRNCIKQWQKRANNKNGNLITLKVNGIKLLWLA